MTHAALVRAIVAGDLDGDATRRHAAATPLGGLLLAIALAGAGRWASARATVDAALARRERGALLDLIGGLVRYACDDHTGALELLNRARAASRSRVGWLDTTRLELADRLGFIDETRALRVELAREEPSDARLQLDAAAALREAGALAEALEFTDRAAALTPDALAPTLDAVALLAALGRRDEALARLDAVRDDGRERSGEALLQIADALAELDALAPAAALLERWLARAPGDATARARLAELCAWQGDDAAARRHAAAAIAEDPECAAAHRVLGAAATRARDPALALRHLDRALARDPDDGPAHLWRAEALILDLRIAEAHEAITAARSVDAEPRTRALLRELACLAEQYHGQPVDRARLAALAPMIEPVLPGVAEILSEGTFDVIVATLHAALDRLVSRGRRPRARRGDALTRLPRSDTARVEVEAARERARVAPLPRLLEELDAIHRRYPDSPEPLCLRGDLHLWRGDLPAAAAAFHDALARDEAAVLAVLGLATIDLLEGRADECLARLDRAERIEVERGRPRDDADPVRARLMALQAEALLERGDLDEARPRLEAACHDHPGFSAAWIDLGLVRAAAGDADGCRAILAWLIAEIPAPFESAAARRGLALTRDHDEPTPLADAVALLREARALHRGNRHPNHGTYRVDQGVLRVIPRFPSERRDPDAGRRAALSRAGDLALRAAGAPALRERLRRAPDRPRPDRPRLDPPLRRCADLGRRAPPTFLSPAQIDEFLARGFLRIPGCFSREVGRAWIEDAAARVAGDPKRWVRQLDPSVDLRVFRPEDPATWVVPNFIIDGDQEVEIARFAPRAWAAICDLLGGRERVATTHWSNYINANLRSSLRGASTIVPPTADSWHLDDPRTDTRLDRIRNGLLTVVMFGDVLPASGGTQIAPDSIGLVARVLAEHPDGYDFVDSDAGARITRQCREFLELTGEAGDVVLLHPFMIHTAAPNPSGRIRWMSNPMIHARGFLDFFRDDPAELSPVELAVARALAASPGASEDAARRQRPKGAS